MVWWISLLTSCRSCFLNGFASEEQSPRRLGERAPRSRALIERFFSYSVCQHNQSLLSFRVACEVSRTWSNNFGLFCEGEIDTVGAMSGIFPICSEGDKRIRSEKPAIKDGVSPSTSR